MKMILLQLMLLVTTLGQTSALAGAADGLVIAEAFTSTVIPGESLLVYEDKSGQLEFKDVRELPFEKPRAASLNYGLSPASYWIRLTLDNRTNQEQALILVHEYVQTDWVELYIPEGTDSLRIVNGDRATHRDKRYLVENLRPSFRFNLTPGSSTLYLKVASKGIVQLPFSLWTPTAFQERLTRELLFCAFFLGIIFVMSVYNLFLYTVIRDASYIYYVLFTGTYGVISMNILGLNNIFFPDSVFVNNELYIVLTGLVTILSLRFGATYLDLKVHHKPLLIGSRCLEILGLFTMGSVFLSQHLGSILAITMGTSVPVFLMIAGSLMILRKNRNAYFFSLAWAMLLIFSVYRMLGLNGVVPKNLLTEYGQNLGSIAEIIILSLGVGDKIRRQRNEIQRQRIRAEQQKNDAESKLRSSLQTRVAIVSNLAHRMNNPLNYIQTGVGYLMREMGCLRKELLALFPPPESLDDEGRKVCRNFLTRLDEIDSTIQQIKLGAIKSSQSVSEILSLSGVDGLHIERLSL